VTPHVDCILECPCGAAGGVSASDTTRARASTMSAGENGEQWHYLGIASSNASTVARSGGLRWTGEVAISHRSFRRQTDGSALDRSRGREKIETKKRGEPAAGGFYSRGDLLEGVGLRGGGRNRTEGRDAVLGRSSWPKERDDTRAPHVSEER
jgi:hypothetical protein